MLSGDVGGGGGGEAQVFSVILQVDNNSINNLIIKVFIHGLEAYLHNNITHYLCYCPGL